MLFLILLIAIIIIVVIAAKDNPNKNVFTDPSNNDGIDDDDIKDITIEFKKSGDGSEKAQKVYYTNRFGNVSIDIYRGAKYCDDKELFFIELWHHETKNNLTFSDITNKELLVLLNLISKL